MVPVDPNEYPPGNEGPAPSSTNLSLSEFPDIGEADFSHRTNSNNPRDYLDEAARAMTARVRKETGGFAVNRKAAEEALSREMKAFAHSPQADGSLANDIVNCSFAASADIEDVEEYYTVIFNAINNSTSDDIRERRRNLWLVFDTTAGRRDEITVLFERNPKLFNTLLGLREIAASQLMDGYLNLPDMAEDVKLDHRLRNLTDFNELTLKLLAIGYRTYEEASLLDINRERRAHIEVLSNELGGGSILELFTLGVRGHLTNLKTIRGLLRLASSRDDLSDQMGALTDEMRQVYDNLEHIFQNALPTVSHMLNPQVKLETLVKMRELEGSILRDGKFFYGEEGDPYGELDPLIEMESSLLGNFTNSN